jgi:hypothetical protein
MPELKLATTDVEREAIYRFRYAIEIQELGWRRPQVDHRLRRLVERLDESASLFGAWQDGLVVGMLRSNDVNDTELGDLRKTFSLGRFSTALLERASVSSGLWIAREHRNTDLAQRLLVARYCFGLSRGNDYDLVASPRNMEAFYMGLGYRTYKERARHPDHGDVTPLILVGRDVPYLASVGSPLAQIARAQPVSVPASRQAARWHA